jgi:hypothetical protein
MNEIEELRREVKKLKEQLSTSNNDNNELKVALINMEDLSVCLLKNLSVKIDIMIDLLTDEQKTNLNLSYKKIMEKFYNDVDAEQLILSLRDMHQQFLD